MSQAWNIYEPTFAVPLLIRANRCNNFIKTQKKIQRKFIAQASTLILHSFIRRSHRHIQNITSLHVFVNIIFMYYFSFLSFFFFIKFWVQCSTMIVHINLNEPNSGYIFCCSCRLLCYFYCIFVFSILFYLFLLFFAVWTTRITNMHWVLLIVSQLQYVLYTQYICSSDIGEHRTP